MLGKGYCALGAGIQLYGCWRVLMFCFFCHQCTTMLLCILPWRLLSLPLLDGVMVDACVRCVWNAYENTREQVSTSALNQYF